MGKKIKVRLLDKVNSYRLGDTSYKPGDVFMLPARHFRADFFEKVVPRPKPEPIPEPTPEPPIEPPEEQTEEEAEKLEEKPNEQEVAKKK